MVTLLDNDVVLKTCAWQLADAMLKVATSGNAACLGVARHSIRSRLRRWPAILRPERAQACFEEVATRIEWLEPMPEEIGLAADLEEAAARGGFELDSGESQLAAIAVVRRSSLMLTGDKRAVIVLARVAADRLHGRIACLEQLLAGLCAVLGDIVVRDAVCTEPGADRTAAIAFACGRTGGEPETALASYVRDLRSRAPLLVAGDALAAVVPQEHGVGRP